MTTTLKCQSCGKQLSPGALKYIVEIRSSADYDGYIEEYTGNIEAGINELLEDIDGVDEETLEEDVYLERSYIVCKTCRDRLLQDPFHSGVSSGDMEMPVKGTVH